MAGAATRWIDGRAGGDGSRTGRATSANMTSASWLRRRTRERPKVRKSAAADGDTLVKTHGRAAGAADKTTPWLEARARSAARLRAASRA